MRDFVWAKKKASHFWLPLIKGELRNSYSFRFPLKKRAEIIPSKARIPNVP